MFTVDYTTGAISAGGSLLRKHQPYVCTADNGAGGGGMDGECVQPSPHGMKGLAGKGEGSRLISATQLTCREPPISAREL